MKTIITLTLILCSIFSYGQENIDLKFKIEDNKTRTVEIVEVTDETIFVASHQKEFKIKAVSYVGGKEYKKAIDGDYYLMEQYVVHTAEKIKFRILITTRRSDMARNYSIEKI